jgi:hypothetical protein
VNVFRLTLWALATRTFFTHSFDGDADISECEFESVSELPVTPERANWTDCAIPRLVVGMTLQLVFEVAVVGDFTRVIPIPYFPGVVIGDVAT